MNTKIKHKMVTNAEKLEVTYTREFDAPRNLVFQVTIDPMLIPQWWGPKRYTTVVEEMNVTPGGVWRFTQHDAEGNLYKFKGEYQEVVPPERLVYTFEFEGMPGHIIREEVTLTEQAGKTLMTIRDIFANLEDLEGMMQSGMEEGAVESFDRFEELLNSIPAKE